MYGIAQCGCWWNDSPEFENRRALQRTRLSLDKARRYSRYHRLHTTAHSRHILGSLDLGRIDSGQSMNPRHAAALALVAWYLMVPPSSDLASYLVYQWFQVGSFDSRNACERGRRMMIDRFMADLQRDSSDTAAVHGFDAFYYSQCLAGDDLRLEGKFGEKFRGCEAGNCQK